MKTLTLLVLLINGINSVYGRTMLCPRYPFINHLSFNAGFMTGPQMSLGFAELKREKISLRYPLRYRAAGIIYGVSPTDRYAGISIHYGNISIMPAYGSLIALSPGVEAAHRVSESVIYKIVQPVISANIFILNKHYFSFKGTLTYGYMVSAQNRHNIERQHNFRMSAGISLNLYQGKPHKGNYCGGGFNF